MEAGWVCPGNERSTCLTGGPDSALGHPDSSCDDRYLSIRYGLGRTGVRGGNLCARLLLLRTHTIPQLRIVKSSRLGHVAPHVCDIPSKSRLQPAKSESCQAAGFQGGCTFVVSRSAHSTECTYAANSPGSLGPKLGYPNVDSFAEPSGIGSVRGWSAIRQLAE